MENKKKFESVYMHVGRFAVKNLSRLYNAGIMGDFDNEENDKLKAGMYEVTAMYI